MSGITILTQHPIMEYVGQVWVVLSIVLIIITLGIFISSWISESDEGRLSRLAFYLFLRLLVL